MILDENEIKRYLKYGQVGLDQVTQANVTKAKLIIEEHALFQYVANEYDILIEENKTHVLKTNLILDSVNLSKNLAGCSKMIILVATLGLELDYQIRKLEMIDLSLAYVVNAVAVEYLEKYLDQIQDDYQTDYNMRPRYSVGYGDLSIEYQAILINLVNATKQIGVNVLESHLMVPSKSVSALIGLSKTSSDISLKKCDKCLGNGKCSARCIGKDE